MVAEPTSSVRITVVATEPELRANVKRFKAGVEQQPVVAKRAVSETNLWVLDPLSMSFAPTKFVAYAGICRLQCMSNSAR